MEYSILLRLYVDFAEGKDRCIRNVVLMAHDEDSVDWSYQNLEVLRRAGQIRELLILLAKKRNTLIGHTVRHNELLRTIIEESTES